jgi:hypothetical protein
MRCALRALVISLAIGPVANDACCDLDAPAAPSQTASADASCPLHAQNGTESTTPGPQPVSPIRCTHDVSTDRAGLVKSVPASAPDLAIVMIEAPPAAGISALRASHGDHPVSAHVFVRVRPPAGHMGRTWNMRMAKPVM